jgi:hypothetical protein
MKRGDAFTARATRQLREYKLACFPITEALRIGLIDRHTAFVRMRQAYVDVYGDAGARASAQAAVVRDVFDKAGVQLNVTPFVMGQQIIAERERAIDDDTIIKEQE